jgi:MFS family permease
MYWAGQAISTLGSSVTAVVLPLLIFQLTHSSLNLALTVVVTVAPYLLFGLVIGAWVDRVDRRRLMILTDLARMVVVAAIPLAAALGAFTVWEIYVVAFVSSALAIGFDAASFAAIPSLVEPAQLVRANGRIQASYSVARAAGPFVAGLLLAVTAAPNLLAIDAASFLVSAGSLALVRRSFNPASLVTQSQARLRGDVVEGLRYVWRQPIVRTIVLLLFVVNFVVPTVSSQLVLFAKEVLVASDAQVGFLYAAGGAGTIVCALLVNRLGTRRSLGTLALAGLALEGLAVVVASGVRVYGVVLIVWSVRGGADVLFVICTYSLAQRIVPNALLGRVITIVRVLTWSTASVGALLGGYVIAATGSPALVYGVIGALVCLTALGFFMSPLGRVERYAFEDPVSTPSHRTVREEPVSPV